MRLLNARRGVPRRALWTPACAGVTGPGHALSAAPGTHAVVLAQAGIELGVRTSSAGAASGRRFWTPACAGVTGPGHAVSAEPGTHAVIPAQAGIQFGGPACNAHGNMRCG